jgi:TRAP-type C4-dicarboxylate transport system permease small subunit
MTEPIANDGGTARPDSLFVRAVRAPVLAMAVVGGVGVLAMMLITCVDVVGRILNHPLKGAYDLVCASSVVAIAGALPYTTAAKGHVAIDLLMLKLPKAARRWLQAAMSVVLVAMLGLLAWECLSLGLELRERGNVSPTLQMPVFWMPCVIGVSCAVSAWVLAHQAIRPQEKVVSL